MHPVAVRSAPVPISRALFRAAVLLAPLLLAPPGCGDDDAPGDAADAADAPGEGADVPAEASDGPEEGDGEPGDVGDGADGEASDAAACDPFADRMIRFDAGGGAGTGQDRMPEVVLGPPVGGGDSTGGNDVLTLGIAGAIVVALDDGGIVDGAGPDFIVFENPFNIGGDPTRPHAELGVVGVSEDGVAFLEYPCDHERYPFTGCAGWHPVYAAPGNGIDPTDPAAAGGDAFDLADVGLDRAAYVRIRDIGLAAPTPPSAGFDLDAVASVWGCPR